MNVDDFHDAIDANIEQLKKIIQQLKAYDQYDLYTFHPQAIDTAYEIVSNWMAGGDKYSILLAQMQSGKTGTYTLTAIIMYDLGLIDNMYIICGESSKALKKQTNFNLTNALLEYLNIKKNIITEGEFSDIKRRFGIIDNSIDNSTIRDIIAKDLKIDDDKWLTIKISSKFTIGWSQDLETMPIITNKSLIVSEESHYANSKGNRPYTFWKKNRLDKALSGNFTALNERNIYILSVSATPFAEWTMNERVKLDLVKDEEEITFRQKDVFRMEPGPAYKGIKYYLENRKINFTANAITDCSTDEHLRTIIRNEKYNNKYIIIRLTKKGLGEKIRTICHENRYNYKELFGKSELSFSLFDNQPNRTTIVVICALGRMGQDFSKKYIGMIYEPSKAPNTDTALQAGVGRMCGYQDNEDIDIFVSPSCETSFKKYVYGFYNNPKEFAEINKVRHIQSYRTCCKNGIMRDADGKFWKMFIPVKFKMSDLEKDSGDRVLTLSEIVEDPCIIENLFANHPDILINFSIEERSYIKQNIVSLLLQEKVSFRRSLEYDSYEDTKDNLNKAILEKEFTHDKVPYIHNFNDRHTNQVKPITFIGDEENVFIIGFTFNINVNEQIKAEQIYRLANIEKTCIYKFDSETTDREEVDILLEKVKDDVMREAKIPDLWRTMCQSKDKRSVCKTGTGSGNIRGDYLASNDGHRLFTLNKRLEHKIITKREYNMGRLDCINCDNITELLIVRKEMTFSLFESDQEVEKAINQMVSEGYKLMTYGKISEYMGKSPKGGKSIAGSVRRLYKYYYSNCN